MAELFRHQRIGVNFLLATPRACLFDEPGLGKTAQALAALERSDAKTATVVCPAVMRATWRHEAATWAPSWASGARELRVCSYAKIDARDTDVLILDEAHAVKNPGAVRSQKILALGAKAQRIWALTGTPITKDPFDLWGLLSCIGALKASYGSKSGVCRFWGVSWAGQQYVFGTPRQDCWRPMHAVMLRRTRAECLDLPPKLHERVYIDLPKRDSEEMSAILAKYSEDDPAWDRWSSAPELAHAIARLGTIKAELCADLYADLPRPLVVFSAHREPILALQRDHGAAIIVGDTADARRQEIVTEFQKGSIPLLGITIQSGGVGLTLTRACTAVFVDRTYSHALNSQAEDRLYRIGQDRAVRIVQILADHPIERRIDEILARKRHYQEQ